MIAALYVMADGIYAGSADVEIWDEVRDARKYAGPHPVVAHPPCERWCRMAPLVQKTHGYKVGDDGGCFAHALECVHRLGGVLEHPELSYAFARHGMAKPPKAGGWIPSGDGIGHVCHVEQGHYGHRARKATWLYSAGCALPELRWGKSSATAYVTDGGGDVKRRWSGNVDPARKRLSKREASATPPPIRRATAEHRQIGEANGGSMTPAFDPSGCTHWDEYPASAYEDSNANARKESEMKRAKQSRMFRQGDVLIVAVECKPDLQPVEREGGRIVLAHGEVTGHAHAIASSDAVLFMDAKTLDRYLEVRAPVTLDHEEHSRIEVPSGFFKVTIQREYRPEGVRSVVD